MESEIPNVEHLQPYVRIQSQHKPLVSDLINYLKHASEAIRNETVVVSADIYEVRAFVDSLEARAILDFRICMEWGWNLYMQNGICTLEITVKQYDFAYPFGYSLQ